MRYIPRDNLPRDHRLRDSRMEDDQLWDNLIRNSLLWSNLFTCCNCICRITCKMVPKKASAIPLDVLLYSFTV